MNLDFTTITQIIGAALLGGLAVYAGLRSYLANKKQELYDRARLDVPLWTRRKR